MIIIIIIIIIYIIIIVIIIILIIIITIQIINTLPLSLSFLTSLFGNYMHITGVTAFISTIFIPQFVDGYM